MPISSYVNLKKPGKVSKEKHYEEKKELVQNYYGDDSTHRDGT